MLHLEVKLYSETRCLLKCQIGIGGRDGGAELQGKRSSWPRSRSSEVGSLGIR